MLRNPEIVPGISDLKKLSADIGSTIPESFRLNAVLASPITFAGVPLKELVLTFNPGYIFVNHAITGLGINSSLDTMLMISSLRYVITTL